MKFGLLLLLFSQVTFAQVGASSSPVLLEGSLEEAPHEALMRGRYQIKKSSPASETRVETKKPAVRTPASEKTDPVVEKPVVKPEPQVTNPEVNQEDQTKVEEPSLTEQAKGLLTGDPRALNLYKEQIHPDDIRNNRLEIQGAPSLVYNGSSANYSYRNYHSFFTAMDLSSNVWMAPSIGLYGRILFSFGASVSGDDSTSSLTPVKYEDLDLGIKFRRFFGMSRTASSVEFALIYSDWKMLTPNDNIYRPKLVSTGAGIKLTSRIPSSAHHAWIFGGSFYPRLQHQEEPVGITVSSGSVGENTRLSLNFGSEVKFSRENQIIYDLNVSTERNAFDGTASPVDPETGNSPSSVTVTNTFVQFSFGYRWGR